MAAAGSHTPDRFRSHRPVDGSEPFHPGPFSDRRPVRFPVGPRGPPPHRNGRRLRVPCLANPPSSKREISVIARPEAGIARRTCVTKFGYFVSILETTRDDFAQGFYRVCRYRRYTLPRG